MLTEIKAGFYISTTIKVNGVLNQKKKTEFEDDQTIHHKVMITIIRRFSEGYIIDYLNSGISYNSSFFKENILDTLIEKKNKIWLNSSGKKKLVTF